MQTVKEVALVVIALVAFYFMMIGMLKVTLFMQESIAKNYMAARCDLVENPYNRYDKYYQCDQ